MNRIRLIGVGKVKEKYFTEGIDYYGRQIRSQYPFEVIECQDEPTPDGASEALENQIRKIEGQRILQKIHDDDYVVALCIDGKHYSTEEWQKRVLRTLSQVSGDYVLVIGGSLGLSPEVVKRANEKLSFSCMTFPHQLMRMILCEQLSRVLSQQ